MPLPPPPPPPPPAPPPPPPAGLSAPPPKTKDRAALLNDIQKGRALKKVVTNDRSAPIIDGKASAPAAPSAHSHSRPGPGGGGGAKFPAPAIPTGLSFADELTRKLGGNKNLARNSPDNGNSTNRSIGSINDVSSPSANGVNSRPLPAPPPPHSASTPSFSAKPVQSQGPKPPPASVKPPAPQPNRGGGAANGVGRNFAKQSETTEDGDDDGRYKGPSVKDRLNAFAGTPHSGAPPPPPSQTLKRPALDPNRFSSENGEYNDDGAYATKAAPPALPSKPPSKPPPQNEKKFHTLNPHKLKQQQHSNIPHRSGSHENLPAMMDGSQGPPPPPKATNSRSPGAASRPAPPPPGRPPPPPPERPSVAPPPPPPPPVQTSRPAAQNGRHNVRSNEAVLRNVHTDNSPAPPPRRESLMPDLERRFSFVPLHELPSPEEFRGIAKVYGRHVQSSQQRSKAPDPPGHR